MPQKPNIIGKEETSEELRAKIPDIRSDDWNAGFVHAMKIAVATEREGRSFLMPKTLRTRKVYPGN